MLKPSQFEADLKRIRDSFTKIRTRVARSALGRRACSFRSSASSGIESAGVRRGALEEAVAPLRSFVATPARRLHRLDDDPPFEPWLKKAEFDDLAGSQAAHTSAHWRLGGTGRRPPSGAAYFRTVE